MSSSDGLEALARRRIGGESIDLVAEALRSAGFSATAYRAANEDLTRALPDDEQALWHFLAYCGEFTHIYPVAAQPEGFARLCELRTPSRLKADIVTNILSCFGRPESALWTMPIEDRKKLLGDLCESVGSLGPIYVVVGDSHSNLYRYPVAFEPREGRFMLPLHILCTGSSARGLANSASRSGSGARLASFAKSLPDSDIELFFKFGQVDVEFAFNFDRIRSGRAAFEEAEFARFCEQSTNAYISFITDHFTGRPLNVMSIFPPALSDAAWHDGYTNAQIVSVETDQRLEDIVGGVRALEIPLLAARTRHHAIYNEMLATKAASAGFAFFDDFTRLLGSAGTVDLRYIPTHLGSDHHLEFSPTTEELSSLIRAHFAARGPDVASDTQIGAARGKPSAAASTGALHEPRMVQTSILKRFQRASNGARGDRLVEALNHRIDASPSARTAIDALPGWSHPPLIGGGGEPSLYADPRIDWCMTCAGPLAGRTVLELGPLDGAHTAMLARAGPARIIAIEANTLAFLRCLVTREVMHLDNTSFRLGDFNAYMSCNDEIYDLVVASGVLYHSKDPIRLIDLICHRAKNLYVWTHYFDDEVMGANDPRRVPFSGRVQRQVADGEVVDLHERSYFRAWRDLRFCGGFQDKHYWMTRSDIVRLIERHGFVCEIAHDEPFHVNGPAFSLFARRAEAL